MPSLCGPDVTFLDMTTVVWAALEELDPQEPGFWGGMDLLHYATVKYPCSGGSC
jgi:hypothetical protein